jgi:hypothetical protein
LILYERSYNVFLSVFGLFHLAHCFLGPSMLLQNVSFLKVE